MPAEKHDIAYYQKCMLGGILSCGITHTAVCPLDIVKCRKQANPKLYKSIPDGFKTIWRTEGFKGFKVGWLPTFYGYSMQGLGKFGFYEIFKDVYKGLLGVQAERFQTIGFLTASACAEVIADIMLCPMEALKVRMQTSDAGTFTTKFSTGFNQILKAEGVNGFYKGISPLWARQVPYTMMKFAGFENTVKAFYKYVFIQGKENYTKSTQLMITFMSGYIAGIFCALVSHPADTMVSIINKKGGNEPMMTQVKKIYKEIGFKGLWNGLFVRIIMIGTLTGLQWWIYDSFKVYCGLQTTGGSSAAHKPANK